MATDVATAWADADLVTRAQTGDPDAMDDLLSTWRPTITRFCRYRLSGYAGGRDTADDAVQETCLAVASVLHSYQDQGVPFRAWVYAIAANKVRDSQRRSGRGEVLVDELPEQVEPSPTPEECAVVAAQYQAARALVDRLPLRMGQVVRLRADGATSKRVAEVLGIGVAAVNVAHSRALVRLRELAGDTEEFAELLRAAHRPVRQTSLGQVA